MSKQKTSDQAYFNARKQFSKKYGARELWSVMDHWPLYCGVMNLARNLAIVDIFRSVLDVPGDIAEFGSWRGAGVLLLAKLLQIYDPNSPKSIHCFDSFEGLTEFTKEDARAKQKRGEYKGSYRELLDVINLYGMTKKIKIHKGYIEQTLPQVLESNKALTFSLVYCDTDLYESTKCILELCHERLIKGGVFVFDEWNCEQYPGEGMAANQFLKQFGKFYKAEHVRNTRQPTMILRRIK